MNFILRYYSDFLNLFFPKFCEACGNNLLKNENIICTLCLYQLPKTNYHKEKDNPIAQLFWGKVHIENATAFYHFFKGSKFQDLIHNLKYKGKKEIGSELGKHLGAVLKDADLYQNIDVIVPIPLHPKRQKKRGYNQSEWIGKGLSESMKIPMNTTSLYRSVATETQTKKSKLERWSNVENIFKIKENKDFENKHILLVDDVITTGSTIEACANILRTLEGTKVSVACLAVASK